MSKGKKCSCSDRPWFPAKVRAKVGQFERIITFKPGYVCEIPFGRGDSHGRHGADMLWVLIGKYGAISFTFFTGWMPDWSISDPSDSQSLPGDLGYHNRRPMYDGQTASDYDCPWVGGACYSDGSGLNAMSAWKIMEDYYRELFENE